MAFAGGIVASNIRQANENQGAVQIEQRNDNFPLDMPGKMPY